MQDMHGGGGGGRFFGGGDRRLRPHNHLSHLANVKCPRCDSINTKFCYYNNYNLSQPRHFCKSCRRYWTKGGVLRNVPVGGGCRKAKRSKPKSAGAATTGDEEPIESKSNAQSSSSESSSLTAAAATATFPPSAATAVAEEGSAPSNTTSNSAVACNFTDSKLFNVNPEADPNFDHQPLVNHPSTDGQIFSTEIGSFTSLMSSSEEMMVGFGMGDINPTTSYGGTQQVNQAMVAGKSGPEIVGSAGAADEFKMHDVGHEELTAALDWGNGGGGGDQELFDLTAGVDPAYWTQSQWTDNDHSLNYLP